MRDVISTPSGAAPQLLTRLCNQRSFALRADKRKWLSGLLMAVAIALLVPGTVAAKTQDEQMCLDANTRNDGHALDEHCPIAAAQQLDLSRMTSDPKEAQNAKLLEGGYLFLAAKGALLTMQFQLGAAELMKAALAFKDVRDHGVSKGLRARAMTGLQMVDDTVSRLSHLGDH